MKGDARDLIVPVMAVVGAACGAAACVGMDRLLAVTYGPESWAGGLLSDWINVATCACFGSAIALLVERCVFVFRQRAVPHVAALGDDEEALLMPDDVKAARQQFAALPPGGRCGLSARLLDAGLQRARAHWSAEDVSDAIKTEAELVQTRTYAEYSMIRFLIWAIPTLGFIGTVVGISLAMGVLSGTPMAGAVTARSDDARRSRAGDDPQSRGQDDGGRHRGAQQGGIDQRGSQQGGDQRGGGPQGGAGQGANAQPGGARQEGSQQGGPAQGSSRDGGGEASGGTQAGGQDGDGQQGDGTEGSGRPGQGTERDANAQEGEDATGNGRAGPRGTDRQGEAGDGTTGSPPVSDARAGGREESVRQGSDGATRGTGGPSGPSRVITDLPGQKPPSGNPPARRFSDRLDLPPGSSSGAAAPPRDGVEMATAQRALAMAFNTTFVALVLSLVAMFLMHRVESWEEGLLVDATRGVLRRLPLRMYIRQERLP